MWLTLGGSAAYVGEERRQPRVQGERPCDFLDSVDNRGMVAVSEEKADLFKS